MKGIILQINNQRIVGGIEQGSTGAFLTFTDGKYKIVFSSTDETSSISHTWHSSEFKIGDVLKISFEEVSETSEPTSILDYNNPDDINKGLLERYYELRGELIKDGLLEDPSE